MEETRTDPAIYDPNLSGVATLIADMATDSFTRSFADYLRDIVLVHDQTVGGECNCCDEHWPCSPYQEAQELGLAWLIYKVTGV